MTYAEFLRTQGASDEDVKVLDTTIGRKAFDAQQAAADESIRAYKANADQWYETVATPALTKAQSDAAAAKQAEITARAESARLRSLVVQSQDEGLKAVAKEMGYTVDGGGNPPLTPTTPVLPAGFDPSKFVSTDSLAGLMDRAGEGLAQLQDMVAEHAQLFPTQRIDVRQLRRDAVAAKKDVYSYWEDKYKVPAAREKQTADQAAANESRIRKEERDRVTAEFVERAANPNLIPGSTSINPLAARPTAGREKQPWEAGLDAQNGSNDRTARAAKIFAEKQTAGVH